MSYNYVAEIKQYSGKQLLRYRIFDAWLYFYSLQYFTLSTVSGLRDQETLRLKEINIIMIPFGFQFKLRLNNL